LGVPVFGAVAGQKEMNARGAMVEAEMQDMMNSMGGMMWGMGLVWLLVIVVLVLAAAALSAITAAGNRH
jgi:heme/copper-type cytochrome/quinol oxidase subunit 2